MDDVDDVDDVNDDDDGSDVAKKTKIENGKMYNKKSNHKILNRIYFDGRYL